MNSIIKLTEEQLDVLRSMLIDYERKTSNDDMVAYFSKIAIDSINEILETGEIDLNHQIW